MELSNCNIKKKFYTFSKGSCSYISENGNPGKISYIFSKESCSYILENGNPEKIPYISGNGTFLYCGKRKPRKNSLSFWKRNFLILQETETLKNLLIFQEVTF